MPNNFVGKVCFVAGVIYLLLLSTLFIRSISDTIGVVEMVGKGVVSGRAHTNPYRSVVSNGRFLTGREDYIEKWILCVKLNTSGGSGCSEVSKEVYESTKDGTQADVVYSVGRWSNKIQVKSLLFR